MNDIIFVFFVVIFKNSFEIYLGFESLKGSLPSTFTNTRLGSQSEGLDIIKTSTKSYNTNSVF